MIIRETQTFDYSPATVTLSSAISNTILMKVQLTVMSLATYQITIAATLDSPQPVDAVIDLAQVGGSADCLLILRHKWSYSHSKAGQTTASATVEYFKKQGDIEGDETLFIGGTSKANFDVTPFSHSVTITNDHINDVLDFTMDWAGSYSYSLGGGAIDVTIDYCSADFDLILFTAAGAYVGYVLGTADRVLKKIS